MEDTHVNARLETFCDGVFAIAMTLLVIDIKLPTTESIGTTAEVWHALQHLAPSVFAFVLSFAIILITWVNHHGTLKLVHKSTASFIYSNGFLLLGVVFIPFPTSLLGEFIGTDHAAPAVVLYNAALTVLALGWIVVSSTALTNNLTKDDKSTTTMRETNRNAYFAVAFYALLAITGLWFPLAIAVVTTASWIVWLVLGIRMKHG